MHISVSSGTLEAAGARPRRLACTALALVLAAALTGCGISREVTGSISRGSGKPVEQLTASELPGATAALGRAYTRDTTNKDVALRYASVLQMGGQTDQSLAVMRKLVIDHPKDRSVLAAYGKSLAAVGRFEPALDAIRRAQTPEYPDWKLFSAEAAILDQLGEKGQARELYRKA